VPVFPHSFAECAPGEIELSNVTRGVAPGEPLLPLELLLPLEPLELAPPSPALLAVPEQATTSAEIMKAHTATSFESMVRAYSPVSGSSTPAKAISRSPSGGPISQRAGSANAVRVPKNVEG